MEIKHPPDPTGSSGGSSSSKKRHASELGLNLPSKDEPPPKIIKQYHGQRDAITADNDRQIKVKNEPRDKTPDKTEAIDVPQASPADSAYDSPLSRTHTNSVTNYSSGIETELSDCGTPSNVNTCMSNVFGKSKSLLNTKLLQRALERKFVCFKEELDACKEADILYSKGVISDKDMEHIREENIRSRRVDTFIKAIAHSKEADDEKTRHIVKEAISKAGYDHIVQDFLEDKDVFAVHQTFESGEVLRRLRGNCRLLEDEVEPRRILDYLVVYGVLNLDEHECIYSTTPKPIRLKHLIQYITRNPERNFYWFCKALGTQYPYLELMLLHPVSASKKQLKTQVTASLRNDVSFEYSNSEDATVSTAVEFTFSGDNRHTEQMIVDENKLKPNEKLFEEAMKIGSLSIDDIIFSCVRINLTGLSNDSQQRFLKRCEESPEFLKIWIQHIVVEKHIKALEQSRTKSVSFKIIVSLPTVSNVSCRCKLSKRAIVTHFSFLENEMVEVEHMIQKFVDFQYFDEFSKKEIADILLKTSKEDMIEAFLRKVLSLKCFGVCLFEKALRDTGQEHILQRLLDDKTVETDRKRITRNHIKSSLTFLQEELEPKRFVETLRNLRKTDEMLSTDSRKNRCKTFLDSIINDGQSAVDSFVAELERIGMKRVIDVLKSASSANDSHDKESLKESILVVYKQIIDEVEPKMLRSTFVERRVIKKRQFDAACKHSARRARAIWFMNHLMKVDTSGALQCFVDALEIAGYEHLALLIKKDMGEYKHCPRLYQATNARGNTVVIKGEFDLQYEQSKHEESSLQVYLHKMIYKNQNEKPTDEKGDDTSRNGAVDKTSFTRDWITTQNQQGSVSSIDQRKRKIDLLTDTSEDRGHGKRSYLDNSIRRNSPDSLSSGYGECYIREDEAPDHWTMDDSISSNNRSASPIDMEYEDISPPASPVNDPHFVPFDTSPQLISYFSTAANKIRTSLYAFNG